MLPRTLIFSALLTGCTAFPVLDVAQADRNAPFPALIPLGPVLAQADALGAGSTDRMAGLGSRIDQLNARASILRGGVVDAATRARMQAGVDTTALQ